MSWTLEKLQKLFDEENIYQCQLEHGVLLIRNEDDLEASLSVSGSQMVVESLLFSASQVNDVAPLNDAILRTHKFFPLTTVCINNIQGDDYYMAFGALSSDSRKESVLLEIEMLFMNIHGMMDAYNDYFDFISD